MAKAKQQNSLENDIETILQMGWTGFADKSDFLDRFHAHIDDIFMAEIPEKFSNREDFKDRLFELLMIRFDILRPYKSVLKEIFYNLAKDPPLLLKTRQHLHKNLTEILKICDFDMSCPIRTRLRMTGLGLIYSDCFRTWLNDESDDSAKTMSQLDKRLSQAHKIANLMAL